MSNNSPSPMNIGGRGSPRDEPQGTPGDRRYGTPPVANIPPRVFDSSAGTNYGSVPQRPPFNPEPISGSGTATPTLNGDDDSDRARVVRRHLVSAEERSERRPSAGGISLARPQFLSRRPSSGAGSTSQNPPPGPDLEEPFPIPYGSHGGDVTHEIYKWHAEQGRENLRRPRSVSFSGPEVTVDPAFRHIREPGGFRRNYMVLAAREQGQEDPRMLHNFIEFLYLYGHFAGEDLEEEEEDDAGTPPSDEERGPLLEGARTDEPDSQLIHRSVASLKPSERTPLMSRSMSMSQSHASIRRRRRQSVGSHGDATVTQALLKSFVGTGVLFLGKAFYNGGMLFSTVVLVVIALVSLWSFLLLVHAKFAVSGSFGDIGGALYGNWMRQLILASIVISQLGFVSAYLIFVAENLQAFILAVSKCQHLVSTTTLIFVQLVIFIPLSLVRNLAKLSTTALVADGFILVGLVYLFSMEAKVISDRGGVADIKWFNEKDFPLLIGTAVFSFEGVGLVIPITDAMREPRKFPKVLTGVMLFLVVLFGGAGALAYAAFGSKIETVVLKNLPQSSKPVQTVQFLYSLAILLSTPLQLFPALRILETALFVKSGKTSLRVKWTKNAFRLLVVLGCVGVSIFGAKDLDKFVSFVGSCACVPLCFVYPAMLHYKAVAKTRFQKGSDIALMVFGMAAAMYTSFQTIKLMAAPSGPAEPVGHCIPPVEPGSGNGPDSPFWPGGRFF